MESEDRRYNLVIADTEQEFLPQIEEEVIRRYADEMTVKILTEREACEAFFAGDSPVDVLWTGSLTYAAVAGLIDEKKTGHLFITASEIEDDDVILEKGEVFINSRPPAEIFYRVEEELRARDILPKEEEPVAETHNTRVLAVYSPIGGCGKSLVAYALAKKLRKLDQKVLLVPCDPTQSASVYFAGGDYAKDELADKLLRPDDGTYWTILQNIRQDDIAYLLPFEKNLTSLEIGMSQWVMLLTVLREKEDFDYIILDVGTLLDRGTASLLAKVDFLILLTESNQIANRKMQKLLSDSGLLPKCECFLLSNEYRSDGMRIAPETIFGTISQYGTWEEALDDPVFYQMALKVTE